MSATGVPEWMLEEHVPCLKYVSHWHANTLVLCWDQNDCYKLLRSWPHGAVCACSGTDDAARALRLSTRLLIAVAVYCFDCVNKVWEPVVLLLPRGALREIVSCESAVFWIERKSLRETRVTPFEQRYFPPEKTCSAKEMLLDFANYQIEATKMRFPPLITDSFPSGQQFTGDAW
jgi:hypothetical protein